MLCSGQDRRTDVTCYAPENPVDFYPHKLSGDPVPAGTAVDLRFRRQTDAYRRRPLPPVVVKRLTLRSFVTPTQPAAGNIDWIVSGGILCALKQEAEEILMAANRRENTRMSCGPIDRYWLVSDSAGEGHLLSSPAGCGFPQADAECDWCPDLGAAGGRLAYVTASIDEPARRPNSAA